MHNKVKQENKQIEQRKTQRESRVEVNAHQNLEEETTNERDSTK